MEARQTTAFFTTGNKLLILALLAFGIGLRFAGLADLTMTEREAINASAALASVEPNFPADGTQPFYLFLTSLLFKLFTANNFTARLAPAIFGISLLFLPFAFRQKLSPKVLTLWLLLLALDPGLIAWGKRADEASIVIALAAYLAAAIFNRANRWIPVLTGALLASLQRSLPLALAAAIVTTVVSLLDAALFNGEFQPHHSFARAFSSRTLCVAFALALLFAVSFFANPAGIGILGSGLISAFNDASIQLPGSVWLFLAIVYDGFGIVLTISAWIEGNRTQNRTKLLLSWGCLIAALALLLFNQGALVFVFVAPLMTLVGAVELDSLLNREPGCRGFLEKISIFIPIGFLLGIFLTASVAIRFARQANTLTTAAALGSVTLPFTQAQQFFIISTIVLIAVLLIVPMILRYFSARSLRQPLTVGFLIAVLAVSIANAWDAAGFSHQNDSPASASDAVLPLIGNQRFIDDSVLIPTLNELSGKSHRSPTEIRGMVVLSGIPSAEAGYRWSLRAFPKVVFSPFPIKETLGDLDFYLTFGQPQQLLHSCSGMDFVRTRTIDFAALSDLDWLNWVVYRDLPAAPEILTLWEKTSALYAN